MGLPSCRESETAKATCFSGIEINKWLHKQTVQKMHSLEEQLSSEFMETGKEEKRERDKLGGGGEKLNSKSVCEIYCTDLPSWVLYLEFVLQIADA